MDSSTSVLTIAVGMYVGLSLMGFFMALTRDLVTPVVASLFPGVQASVDSYVITIGSVKLKVGDAIASTINLLIVWFVVSSTLPFLKTFAPIGGRR
jgi:large-conductance mechanosensitive channel